MLFNGLWACGHTQGHSFSTRNDKLQLILGKGDLKPKRREFFWHSFLAIVELLKLTPKIEWIETRLLRWLFIFGKFIIFLFYQIFFHLIGWFYTLECLLFSNEFKFLVPCPLSWLLLFLCYFTFCDCNRCSAVFFNFLNSLSLSSFLSIEGFLPASFFPLLCLFPFLVVY